MDEEEVNKQIEDFFEESRVKYRLKPMLDFDNDRLPDDTILPAFGDGSLKYKPDQNGVILKKAVNINKKEEISKNKKTGFF